MKAIRIVSVLLARIFLSLVFLVSAFQKIVNWGGKENDLMNALCDWQSYAGFSQPLQECVTALVPWGSLLLAAGLLLELSGGLLLLFGFREKLGAALLILFLIPATLLFHSFWFLEGASRDLQQIMFFKNLGVLGGLILVVLHGAEAKAGSDSSMGSL